MPRVAAACDVLPHPVWGDPAGAPQPPVLRGEVRADVCVIGLGGSGLAAAGALLDAGARVAALEAGPVGGGAAGRNGGFLLAGASRFHHDAVDAWGRERAVALYGETLAELDRLERELGPEFVRRRGSLRLPADAAEAEDCARHRDALARDGLPVAPAPGGGVLVPTDGAVQPLARCRALAAAVGRRGGRLFAGSPALGVAGEEVRTPEGRVRCGAVVVAVDGGLETLLPELAGRVRSTRLQMLATAPLAPGLVPRPVYARHGYDYWQQLPGGRIALGGARDRHAAAEWDAPAVPTPEVQADLDRLLREELGVVGVATGRLVAHQLLVVLDLLGRGVDAGGLGELLRGFRVVRGSRLRGGRHGCGMPAPVVGLTGAQVGTVAS